MIQNLADTNRITTRWEQKFVLDSISQYLLAPASEKLAHHANFHIHNEVEGGMRALGGEGYG